KLAPPDAKIQSFDPVDDWALDIETKDNSEPLLRKSTLDLALILTIVSFIIFVFFTFRKLRAMQRAGVYVSHPGDLTGPDPVVQAYQVLGLSPGATIDEVKQNYRKLAKKFHHDRLTSDKIPDEVKALAGQEFQKIQHAYEVLKIELGFS
ncbi:MAG: DnaJ domain-containing protein, partial [Bdellovibrionales bacterium]|nr:DnaJ domain-containing protein [Bdellovibrionales bacterium]